MLIVKVFNFITRYLFRHPVFVLTYLATYKLRRFSQHASFYSDSDISNLVAKGKSIIRLGDGEMSTIPLDRPNGYYRFNQKVNNKVKSMLRGLVENYSDDSPYILSVPRFVNFSNEQLRQGGKLSVWLPTKVMFFLNYNKQCHYMDAHSFYYDSYFEKVIEPSLDKSKKVICITNTRSAKKQGENSRFPWRDATYIEVPETDVTDVYDEILKKVDLQLVGLDKKEVVFFVAMGPLGKDLIYRYSKLGYQGIDIGKGFEVFYTQESIENPVDLMLDIK